MRADPDRVLLGASLAFAGAGVLGSVVAIRDQLPGEPLGVSIPLSVPAGLLAGWGAGVAAPWPMPVAAVTAAAAARHREPGAGPGVVCAVIGLGCIAGTVIEPVTRRPRSWPGATGLAIGVNLAASAALIGAGAWHAAGARRRRGGRQRCQPDPGAPVPGGHPGASGNDGPWPWRLAGLSGPGRHGTATLRMRRGTQGRVSGSPHPLAAKPVRWPSLRQATRAGGCYAA